MIPTRPLKRGVALSGLVGAFGAYLIGGDPAESARAAQLAVETNCLPLLFAAASMVWLAVDLYDAYKAGGVDAVVTELGKQIAIQIAGGAIMKGVIAGARHLLMSPTSKKIFGKMMELIDDTPFAKEALDQGKALAGKALDQGAKLMDRFDQSKLGKFLNMLDAKLTEFSLLTAEQLKNLYLTPVLQGAGQAGGKIAAKGAVKAEGHAAEDVLEAVEDEAIKRYNKYKVPNRKEYGKDIPLNPGDDPNWSSKIWGTAQKTGTPGHAETCIHIAVIMSRDPNVAQVVLNRGYHLVTGLKIAPNRRPDVFVKYKDGTYKVFEVPSKTDFVDILQNRNEIAMKMLPEHMRGKVLVKPIATLEELMEKFLERK